MDYLKREKSKVFIIAEAGINHNGSLSLAKKLVDAAIWAGATAVKFQTFITEENQSCVHLSKKYLSWAKSMELSFSEFEILMRYCQKRNILFLSTPFEFRSVDFLDRLGVALFKISSSEVTNIPLLQYMARKGRPIIISTGMADLKEISLSLKMIKDNLLLVKKKDRRLSKFKYFRNYIVLLHCASEYPAPYAHINLRAMYELYDNFKLPVGISDHSLGIEIPIAAVAMGACVVEKHLTLDKDMGGPDHAISLLPQELKVMVKAIRNVEVALGSGTRFISKKEKELRKVARKSIVAARNLKKGEIIKNDMIYFMRPGKGISPSRIDKILGKRLLRNMRKDEMFSFKHLCQLTGR